MIKFITKHIALKVTLYVNLMLLLVIAGGSTYIILKQSTSLESQLLERGRLASLVGARMSGVLLEEAIDNGVFTIHDAFDTAYELIEGFYPPKYHTRYDFYLDKALLGVEDEFLKDDSVVYAVAADINGYVPTHNTRYNAPPPATGKRILSSTAPSGSSMIPLVSQRQKIRPPDFSRCIKETRVKPCGTSPRRFT